MGCLMVLRGQLCRFQTDPGSPWTQYKKYLLGQKDGKRRISDNAVTQIEKNLFDIKTTFCVIRELLYLKKGLVMGSVQSGKIKYDRARNNGRTL